MGKKRNTLPNNDTLHATQDRAKSAHATYYYTGVVCKHGHDAPRYTSSGQCVFCADNTNKKNRIKSTERRKRMAANVKYNELVPTIRRRKVHQPADYYDGPLNNRFPDFLTVERYLDINIFNKTFGGNEMNVSEPLTFHNQQELDTYNRIQLEYFGPINARKQRERERTERNKQRVKQQDQLNNKLLGE